MRITVEIRIADSVEAEEAAGRTGIAFPRIVVIFVTAVSNIDQVIEDYDDVIEAEVRDELNGMGFGGLEFEILSTILG